ncbi:MAG: hypothetical protein ACRYG4_11425 [Janthinobacterium lividum]
MFLRPVLAMIFALGLAAHPASAEQPVSPQPQPAADASDIVVEGQAARTLPAYIDKLAVSDFGRQVSRWRTPVCLSITGMSEPYASRIRARFAAVAKSVNVALGAAGCRPNVTIMLTGKSDAITRSLLTRRVLHVDMMGSDPPISDHEKAVALAPRTVRWFGMTETLYSDGTRFIEGKGGMIGTWSASLVRKQTVEGLAGIVILIDEARLTGVTMTQLSDYVTLVALTKPDMSADYTGTDSIMALFAPADGRTVPPGMTRRDQNFLRALYAGSGQMTARQQKMTIARNMRR